jgi:hypothetical protein
MVLFIVSLICSVILWGFAYIGLRQYEFAQQDGDTGFMKFFVHVIFLTSLAVAVYGFVGKERSHVVPNSTVVEETKK